MKKKINVEIIEITKIESLTITRRKNKNFVYYHKNNHNC